MNADPGEAQRLHRLRQFIILDASVSATAAFYVLAVYLWVESLGWLIAIMSMTFGAAGCMVVGLVPLRRGRARAALWWLVAGNWIVALSTASVATFAWPVQIMAAVLPVVVAVPYVSRQQIRVMIVGAIVVAISAASLGLLQDFSGLSDAAPEWVTNSVLIVFAPFMAVLITAAGAQAAATLRDSLELSVEANRELQKSQALLAEQAELLRQSRERIVAAADRERRRIERDLHDGAQQRLVGLSLQISLAREQAVSDPEAQHTLDRIRDEVRHAQEDMRALVQGLYPPVLTQHGLAPALRSMLGQLDNPLRAQIDNVARMSSGREAAVYFVCLEAVQNVLKHAGSSALVTATLRQTDEELRLVVEDDGPGFDASAVGGGDGLTGGAGLTNMADRIGSAGGSVSIESSPGLGTRVVALLPCPAVSPTT